MSAEKTSTHRVGDQGAGGQEGGRERSREPWAQMPGEPDRWYGRFQVYLDQGPTRTLRDTMRLAGEQQRNKGYSWSKQWCTEYRRWRWQERAHAWDAYQRSLLSLSERNARVALRQRRVNVMEETLEAIRAALDTADIGSADQELARQWLPQLRVFLRDMLVAERQEFERAQYQDSDDDNAALITADDLRAAQRALEAEMAAQAPLEPEGASGEEGDKECRFLVCVGTGGGLGLDLAVLRAVRSATGLKFKRLLDPTRPKFSQTLRRQRSLGHPIEYIHFALHASAQGIAFVDGPVDSEWLSERLAGVRVLLLASCAGDSIGDWLGVVPYVISLSEEIAHEDAAALTQHFWQGIGLGQDPAAALDHALAYCPPAVAEYVVRHW